MKELRIPAGFPFKVHPNPHAAQAEDRLGEVMLDLGADPDIALRWQRHDIGAALALFFPDLGPRPMYAASLFSAFFWLIDDTWTDQLDSEGMPQLLDLHRRIDAVLAGRGALDGDELCVRVLALLMAELVALAPADKVEGFAHEMRRFLQATRWEIQTRLRGIVPSLAAYQTMRLITVYWPVNIAISAALSGIGTDPIPRTHPAIQLIDTHAGNYLAWLNDIHSYHRERRDGVTANLITVLAHEFRLPADTAVRTAQRLCAAELDHFIDTAEQLPALGVMLTPRLRQYLTHHESALAGATAWMPTTQRYVQPRD